MAASKLFPSVETTSRRYTAKRKTVAQSAIGIAQKRNPICKLTSETKAMFEAA